MDFYKILKKLVNEHKCQIFNKDDCNSLIISNIILSREVYRHPLSYGYILVIEYILEGEKKKKKIFIKIRKLYKQVPDKYMMIYNKLNDNNKFLPKFYFYYKNIETDESLIAMEYIDGVSLRNIFLRKMIFYNTDRLKYLFYNNGIILRQFHDLQSNCGSQVINDSVDKVIEDLSCTNYFNEEDKEKIKIHLKEIKKNNLKSLPLIYIHHDWSLRNIIIENNQYMKIIDLDAFNRSINFRWDDIAHFLINIESQIKYWPFINLQKLYKLWNCFLKGYFKKGNCNGVDYKLFGQMIYLYKVQSWIDEYPLVEYYDKGLGKLFVKKYNKAIVNGSYTLFYQKDWKHFI